MIDLTDYPQEAEPLCFHSMTRGIVECSPFKLEEITGMKAMCYDLNNTTEYLLAPPIKEFTSQFSLEVFGFGQRPR